MNRAYKTSIIIALSLFVNISSAQKIKYTDPTNFWEVTFDMAGDVSGPTPTYLSYTGDTVYSGYHYYRMQDYNSLPFWVREDTISGKVYFSDSLVNGDKLMLDYNLSVGDTLLSLSYLNISYLDTFILSAIDSVLIGGVPHLVQTFDCISLGTLITSWTKVIEGLGCIEGARMPIAPHVNPGFTITCFENNGGHPLVSPPVSFYFDNLTSCDITSVEGLPQPRKFSNVVPNPSNRSGAIIFNENLTGEISIINILGQPVVKKQLTNAKEIRFSEMELVPALYHYRIIDTEKNVYGSSFVYE
ncbi:MAG: T9SS type A sorting domain-containing protein [Flavipsychrobacter sp.]|nr:T9SS type A sorting domain-containing protein [Flavipsychrobacter sp.]